MSTLPELTETDIARWIGSTSLGRASSYVGSAVFNARCVGNVLKAECQGSMPAPYRVQVTVGKRDITSADCSCPVGDGGRHVTDHEVDAALETLDKLKSRKGAYAYMYDTLSINVARVAEQTRPRDAIRLYMEQVEPLIDARGRENYKIAAGYLARVRKLYKQLGEVPEWNALIANLREKNRTLRALKEELNRLGL